jgi:hypothetical protein
MSLIYFICFPLILIRGKSKSYWACQILCNPFSRASPLGQWTTEEGHGDPSKRAFWVYYDYEMHI